MLPGSAPPTPLSAAGQQAPLPRPRGPLSGWLLERCGGDTRALFPGDLVRAVADPWGEDLHLTLYLIHELSYRGLPGAPDSLEDDLVITSIRLELEAAFERALRRLLPDDGADPVEVVASFSSDDTDPDPDHPSLSAHVLESATVEQFREFLVHRSAYQLKEADPHSWGLPRLAGRAKAALVEIQMDEYGNGAPGRSHAELFATTLRGFGIDDTYGTHIDRLPAITLATTNLISMFGSSRRLLGALVGHLAVFETTSVAPMGRYAEAITRFGGLDDAREFYDVHVEADAHHGPLALEQLVPGFVEDHPDRAAEVCFGARALAEVEGRFTEHLLSSWRAGLSSLRPAD